MARFAALLLTLVCLGAAPAGATGPYPTCDDEIAAQLASLGVEQSSIRSIYVSQRRDTRRSGSRIVGVDVWVRLNGCTGALVLDMTRHCTLRQAYTRGDCQVPGVSAELDHAA